MPGWSAPWTDTTAVGSERGLAAASATSVTDVSSVESNSRSAASASRSAPSTMSVIEKCPRRIAIRESVTLAPCAARRSATAAMIPGRSSPTAETASVGMPER